MTVGVGRGRKLALALCALSTCVALALADGASADRSDDKAELAGLAMNIANSPNPVLAVDGKNHLAYEIAIINQSSLDITLDRVQPRTAGKRLGPALDGDALQNLLRINGGGDEAFIPAGGSAELFLDVTYPKNQKAPRRLNHGFNTTLVDPTGAQPPQTKSYIGVSTKVGREPAIEVGSPLRGPGWVVANGCCNPINAHRGAGLSIDGTVHFAQRFAIDFVQLGQNGKIFNGPVDQLSSYDYFGAPEHSVSAGKVVRVRDGQPEQVPGALPSGQTVQTADGNYVVVKIDPGHYAFYAHMQPGSPRVEVGDRVKEGEVLGLLGNTGNTDAPHLHFHIMDGPSPLQSNGLPFVFKRFTGQGHITNGDELQTDADLQIDTDTEAGPFRDRMPLGFQVIDFGK